MPYRGSMRKFWLGDETNCSPTNIFTQGIFLPDECYQITEASGGKFLMPLMKSLFNALILSWALI